MKIGIVCYPTFGGSGVMATELGIGLAKKGHQIHFISYKRPVRLTSYYKDIFLHEIGSFEYPLFEFPPYDTSLASKIVDVALHEHLDVLHVHYAIPHAAVAYMAKQILKTKGIDLPVITTLHGTDITLVGLDKSMSSVVEFSINQSDIVTSVSNSLKEGTESYFDIKKDIEVVYNFVDLDRFSRKENPGLKKVFAPNGEKIIVHTSNFRKVKRIEDVIHAYSKIKDSVQANLLLIGDGPERRNAEELCRELGTCSQIQFLGKQDAVEEILSIADLFMLPSQNESFGLAALEAMACEVPVISSNAGGLPEVNINGVTGFTCEIGDVDDMAKKAIMLLQDEEMLTTFKKNARQKALEFEKALIIPQYENLYNKAIQNVAEESESLMGVIP
jgi:N-acetyl-alpha-D-glucosaminyl L-malate synthase BshA